MDDLTRHFIATSPRLRYLIHEQENEENRRGEDSQSGPSQTNPVPIEAQMNKAKPNDGKNNGETDADDALENFVDDWRKEIREPKFALECAGFIVLFVYAIYTVRMYYANQTSADAAKRAADLAVRSQRPIMWLSNDNGAPKIFQNPRNAKEGQILWTWHFTNYGKTPPENVRFRQYVKLGSAAPMLAYGEIGDDIGPPTPPGKDEMDTVITDPMPISAAQELIEQGQVSISIHMTYTDTSQSQYETGICLRRTNAGSVAYCQEGNYIH
jgi:hypothetical protein